MRIEGDHDRRAARLLGVPRGGGDDRLMAEMHAIEDADREKERPGKFASSAIERRTCIADLVR